MASLFMGILPPGGNCIITGGADPGASPVVAGLVGGALEMPAELPGR